MPIIYLQPHHTVSTAMYCAMSQGHAYTEDVFAFLVVSNLKDKLGPCHKHVTSVFLATQYLKYIYIYTIIEDLYITLEETKIF